MAEVIEDLEEQSAYDYLKRLTDIHRLHLFDVVMQYRAIFSDDNSVQVQCAVKTHLTLSMILTSTYDARCGVVLSHAVLFHDPHIACHT